MQWKGIPDNVPGRSAGAFGPVDGVRGREAAARALFCGAHGRPSRRIAEAKYKLRGELAMNLFVQRAVATLVLAAQAAGLGTGAAQAAGVNAGAAAQAAPAGAVVQAAGTLRDSQPPVKPTPPTEPTPPGHVAYIGQTTYIVETREAFGEHYPSVYFLIWDTTDPSLSEEERARREQENEASLAEQEAAHEARVDEEYQKYLAQRYAEWLKEKEELDAKAAAEWEAAQAQYQKELAQYNADYAQYQKDLAQWEIAYAQWEKEQAEAQRKPDVDVTTPTTGTDVTAPKPGTDVTAPTTGTDATAPKPGTDTDPSVGNTTKTPDQVVKENQQKETVENFPPDVWDKYDLTPEERAALEILLRQMAGTPKTNGTTNLPSNGSTTRPTVDVTGKNEAPADATERVNEFLAKYPTGTTWDDNTVYKNFVACAAYAFQAQHLAFGADADYVWSKDPADIRQYSIVRISTTSSASHWVFVLSVNEDGTMTTAEGNVNGKVMIGATRTIDANRIYEIWNPA